MEAPKNYSDVDSEALPPVPAMRNSGHGAKSTTGRFDGGSQWRRRREAGGGIDLNELIPKLHTLSREQHKMYADTTLRQHFNDVFPRRDKPAYKVGIEYMDNSQQKDRYLVKVQRNTLEEVKAKLPIKGNYRLFFTHPGNECEEIEDDEAQVPVQRKNNDLYIHCRVFRQ